MSLSDRFRRARRKIRRAINDPIARRDFLFGLSATGIAAGLSWLAAKMIDSATEARDQFEKRSAEMDAEDRRIARRVGKYLREEIP